MIESQKKLKRPKLVDALKLKCLFHVNSPVFHGCIRSFANKHVNKTNIKL